MLHSSHFSAVTIPSNGSIRKTGKPSFGVCFLLLVVALLAAPNAALACACGCSVFDVGFDGFPQESDHGGRIFYEWAHLDQTRNMVGASRASSDLNNDKRLTTDFHSVGTSYMFNRDWGLSVKIPYADRTFTTFDPGAGTTNVFNSRSIGDVEVMAMYTGFANDLSTGVMFGLKLPTGNYNAFGFDRDTAIGSGSTDLILGAFHRGMITGDNAWQYFVQTRALVPVEFKDRFNFDTGMMENYRPGVQIDSAVGIVYNNGYNILGFDKIAPVVQLISSNRWRDRGTGSDPLNTGFDRIQIAPGIEFTKVLDEANHRVGKLYFEVQIPIYYRVNAQLNDNGSQGQLIAPVSYKLVSSYNF